MGKIISQFQVNIYIINCSINNTKFLRWSCWCEWNQAPWQDKIKTSYDNIKIQDNREHRGHITWRTKELVASVHRLVASCKIDAARLMREAKRQKWTALSNAWLPEVGLFSREVIDKAAIYSYKYERRQITSFTCFKFLPSSLPQVNHIIFSIRKETNE